MPLYIAKSGDLDRCYRCLNDWLTHSHLKDSATQLLIKYKSGALVTQLCKRLAGPIFPFSWYKLVWKRISHWMWSLRGSQKPFSCVLGHFRHGDNQTNNRTTNWVRSSLLQLKYGKIHTEYTHDNAWSANSGDNGRNQSAKLYWGQGGRSAVWMPPNWKCKSP